MSRRLAPDELTGSGLFGLILPLSAMLRQRETNATAPVGGQASIGEDLAGYFFEEALAAKLDGVFRADHYHIVASRSASDKAMGLVAAIREIFSDGQGPNPRVRESPPGSGGPLEPPATVNPSSMPVHNPSNSARLEEAGMTSAVEVTERDRERAVKAYVKVLEEEGYWTKPGFKWDSTDPSISIIARHIAAAREEGRQEEERRQRAS